MESLQAAYQVLDSDMIGRACHEVENVSSYDERLSGIASGLSDAESILSDLCRSISGSRHPEKIRQVFLLIPYISGSFPRLLFSASLFLSGNIRRGSPDVSACEGETGAHAGRGYLKVFRLQPLSGLSLRFHH